jgi:hypothetical protein
MTARSARITGLSTLLTLSIGLAGCGLLDDDAPAAKKPASPMETLLNAVPDDDAPAYKFEVTQPDLALSGTYDAPKKAFEAKATYHETDEDVDLTLTMTSLVRREGNWIKISFKPSNLPGLPKLPKKWMKFDPAKVKDTSGSFLVYEDDSADPGNTHFLVINSAGVTEPSPGKFAGTTDITRVPDADLVDAATMKALGEKAKAVPFTAAVDAQRHLSSMALKIPAAGKTKAFTYTVKYSAFGETAVPAVPATGAQTPAPDAAYAVLNG